MIMIKDSLIWFKLFRNAFLNDFFFKQSNFISRIIMLSIIKNKFTNKKENWKKNLKQKI